MSSPQKVVIPKGLVKPNETTIIEIPGNLKSVGTVVARTRPDSSGGGSSPGAPRTPKLVRKRSYTRKTYPTRKPPAPFKNLPEEYTWGGRPGSYESSSSPGSPSGSPSGSPEACSPTCPGVTSQRPSARSPSWSPRPQPAQAARPYFASTKVGKPRIVPKYEWDVSEGDITYMRDKEGLYNFDPPIEMSSSPRWWNDPIDPKPHIPYHPYKGPVQTSSPVAGRVHHPVNAPDLSPGFKSPSPEPESYYKSEVTTSSPEQVETEVTEEQSYYDMGESGGACQKYPSPEGEQGSGSSPGTSAGSSPLMDYLSSLESAEAGRIAEDLSAYQSTRRKLIFDASSLEGPGEIVANMMRHSA